MFEPCYRGKTVLLTGHTGFKGAWMSEWLTMLGANVVGYALNPPSTPSLYDQLDLGTRIHQDIRADIRDVDRLDAVIRESVPDYVFHLAAQSLVGAGYRDPIYNYQTNILGTINVLEAVRRAGRACSVVVVTTDKVYENNEWELAYREDDPLGGHDPYSASKACCEIIVASYRRAFFDVSGSGIKVATARAGNVIGGGDWSADRIVPDCIRSLSRHEPIKIRNRSATRPWQHVLEPISGYMQLGATMQASSASTAISSAFNFGPAVTSNQSVEALVEAILQLWPGSWQDAAVEGAPHEAGRLNLASELAFHQLRWTATWDFRATIEATVSWYRDVLNLGGQPTPKAVQQLTQAQIRNFERDRQLVGA